VVFHIAADMGAHTFRAKFNRLGTFSLTVTDTVHRSITGSQLGIQVIRHGHGEEEEE
jgi:hypothetical protein